MSLADTPIKHLLLTFFSGEAEDYDTIMSNLRDVATSFKGKVSHGTVHLLSSLEFHEHTPIQQPVPLHTGACDTH